MLVYLCFCLISNADNLFDLYVKVEFGFCLFCQLTQVKEFTKLLGFSDTKKTVNQRN